MTKVKLLIGTLLLFFLSTDGVHVALKNNGTYCLIMDSAIISGEITYISNNKTNKLPFTLDEQTVNTSGHCVTENGTETLSIHFLPTNISDGLPLKEQWSIDFTFSGGSAKDDKTFNITDYSLNAVLYSGYSNFNVSKDMADRVLHFSRIADSEIEWTSSVKNGFSCSKSQLKLENDSFVEFTTLKLVAFANRTDGNFTGSDEHFEQCKLDQRTSDLIPIIVGVCLAGLVIIVLVAYLIGRARARRQGYASV